MFTLKQTILLAIAGTAYAAPLAHRDTDIPETGRLPGNFGWKYNGGASNTVVVPTTTETTEIVTVTYYPQSQQTSAPEPQPQVNTSGNTSGNTGNTVTTTSGSTSGSSSGASTGTGYMAVVNKYRSAGGLSALTQSSKLEANALKTAQDGNGEMKHELNPGSMAQVLAPGSASDFEKVYVGGWLCEKPSLAGLNGICGSMTAGWDHSNGNTGHADILSSSKYSNIGCALADGIWACDLS